MGEVFCPPETARFKKCHDRSDQFAFGDVEGLEGDGYQNGCRPCASRYQRCYQSGFCKSELRLKSLKRLARPEGLEPPTYWFEASRSIHLSYGRALWPL